MLTLLKGLASLLWQLFCAPVLVVAGLVVGRMVLRGTLPLVGLRLTVPWLVSVLAPSGASSGVPLSLIEELVIPLTLVTKVGGIIFCLLSNVLWKFWRYVQEGIQV